MSTNPHVMKTARPHVAHVRCAYLPSAKLSASGILVHLFIILTFQTASVRAKCRCTIVEMRQAVNDLKFARFIRNTLFPDIKQCKDAIKFNVLGLNGFVATIAFAASPKFSLVCWMWKVTWEVRRCILSPPAGFFCFWIFLASSRHRKLACPT